MPTDKELLERIQQLEQLNSELHDKLDAIYSILAPDYEFAVEEMDAEEEDAGNSLVQIQPPAKAN